MAKHMEKHKLKKVTSLNDYVTATKSNWTES